MSVIICMVVYPIEEADNILPAVYVDAYGRKHLHQGLIEWLHKVQGQHWSLLHTAPIFVVEIRRYTYNIVSDEMKKVR